MIIRFRIKRASNITFIVQDLVVRRRCWFEVDPLPNDEFYLYVKDEQESFVRDTCKRYFPMDLNEVYAMGDRTWLKDKEAQVYHAELDRDRQQSHEVGPRIVRDEEGDIVFRA